MSEPTSTHVCDPDANAPVLGLPYGEWICPCGAHWHLAVQFTTMELWGKPTKIAMETWVRRAFWTAG